MANSDLSDAIQDYLKEIYKLGIESERVSTSALAGRQQVSAASASAMVKKLAALGLAEHAPYRGVTLTHAGEQVALEVIRHHRLLELYLAETLGIGVDDVHDEADRLEHALSEELEARIDRALGFPTHDPHGDPIPNANLEWPKEARRLALSACRRRNARASGSTSLRVNGFTFPSAPSSSSTRTSSSSAPFAASSASLELVALEEVVVPAWLGARTVLRVDRPADRPHGPLPSVRPRSRPAPRDRRRRLRAARAPRSGRRTCCDAWKEDTIAAMAFRDLFSFLFQRSSAEERVAAYVIREHDRGRDLAEILEDRYVQNRLTPDQRARLLDRPEVIKAIGNDTIADARHTIEV